METSVKEVSGQKGIIVIVTLLVLSVLTLSSLMAINMAAGDGAVMRNSRVFRSNLYRAETGITVAGESHSDSWLAPDSILFDLSQKDAGVRVDSFSLTGPDGKDIPSMGRYVLARIERGPASGTVSEQFYPLNHKAPVPSGSGYSAMNFEIRRYGILSTGSANNNGSNAGVTVEAGLYKVFNRF